MMCGLNIHTHTISYVHIHYRGTANMDGDHWNLAPQQKGRYKLHVPMKFMCFRWLIFFMISSGSALVRWFLNFMDWSWAHGACPVGKPRFAQLQVAWKCLDAPLEMAGRDSPSMSYWSFLPGKRKIFPIKGTPKYLADSAMAAPNLRISTIS